MTPPARTLSQQDVEKHLGPFPESVSQELNTIAVGVTGDTFPSASILDCSHSTYAKIVCALVDVPIEPPGGLTEIMKALHILFAMYCTVKRHEKIEKK